MAGDWIKMRSDLFTHPKVVRITSALKADRLRTVGGLMSVWCLFDAHSIDGRLEGYTLATVDEMVGWPAFAAAMKSVGWLDEDSEGLVLPEFDTHNGQSAKRRAQDSDRKRAERLSAFEADKNGTREEKRREELKQHTPGVPAQISIVLRKYSINSNPSHPTVIALAEQGVNLETLEACCKESRDSKPNETITIGYVVKKLEGWKAQAAQVNVAGAQKSTKQFDDWYKSDSGIERKGKELGMVPRGNENYAGYKERIWTEIKRREGVAA